MFTVDGVTWDVPCSIERESEIKASEISGILLNGEYFNDVIGTYMNYTVKIAVPFNKRDLYNQIYEILNLPIDGHSFILPYNASTVTITGRVENISDVYVRLSGGQTYWKGIQFDIISNAPIKSMSLGQVILRGRTPMPEDTTPAQGTMYMWDGTKWVVTTPYANADNISY